MAYDFDLFVIGGGSGGVRCARVAAAHGARVGVAEERFWGGTCVNVGCVPKKIMVQASEYGGFAEDAAGFGWRAQPGAHDWAALIATKNREIERLNAIYIRLLEGPGAKIFEARATFLDAHTLDVGGQTVTAERIVIATGGQPERPDIPGAELAIVSDDAFFLAERPERIAIVGGGYISVEFAGIFAGLGSQVDLVLRQALPLRGFDEDLREGLAEALQAAGVTLHPSAALTRIAANGAGRVLHLAGGALIETDVAFLATGRRPNIRGLGLERAGVAVSAAGAVIVDAHQATSQPGIYAIGDVTDRLNLTPVAIAEGHMLADALFGPTGRSWSFEAVPTAVFSQPPIATVGLTEAQAAARGPADIYIARFTPMRHTISQRPRKTLMKLVVDQASQRVVGAHILGDDAAEMMQGIAVAVTAGATKQDFDRTIGIHPTSAEELVTLRTRTRVAGAAPGQDLAAG
jgi:glutathione reductase (NADPH)